MGKAIEKVFIQLVFTVQLLSTRYYAKHLVYFSSLNLHNKRRLPEVNSISILQIKTLKLREGKCLAPGHTASEVQTWDLTLGLKNLGLKSPGEVTL